MKFFFFALVLTAVVVSHQVSAAKTYITLQDVQVFDAKQGQQIETWPQGTLFTSKQQNDRWVTVSGTFPKGKWRALSPMVYIERTQAIKERIPYQNAGGRTIIYPALEQKYVNDNARRYKLLEAVLVHKNRVHQTLSPTNPVSKAEAKQTVSNSSEEPLLFHTPELGNEPDIWPKGTVFTSSFEDASYIKVTGMIDGERWIGLEHALWITKPVKVQDRTSPKLYRRDEQARRFVVIDKSKFYVTVYEVLNGNIEKLMRAPVALGYDRCLSKEEGGQCYYTPQGQFNIEFKLFDPDGIHWCIPPKMAAEFKTKIARGERCWRGVMGRHAINFSPSLFLHGTSNPKSIGGNTTHGCVRLRNSDIAMVYRLLSKGDQVLISDTPAEFDLVALAQEALQKQTTKNEIDSLELELETNDEQVSSDILGSKTIEKGNE